MKTLVRKDLGGKSPRREGPVGRQGSQRVIDLVHLSRQTLGDRSLELELLRLFDRQCEQIIDKLDRLVAGDVRLRRDLAHTLKGSARAVGAASVAEAADKFERELENHVDSAAVDRAYVSLVEAGREARLHVAGLLAEA